MLEIRASQNDQLTTASNRPAREPLVNLGQSNRSPCSTLVYTKGRDGGQDEHPWMKGVPERVDESGVKLVNGGAMPPVWWGGAPAENKYPGKWPIYADYQSKPVKPVKPVNKPGK